MYKKEPLVVYWSPYDKTFGPEPKSWNLMYKEPTNLFSELMSQKTKESKDTAWLSCPAVSGRFKNTFVFRNNIETTVHWDLTDPSNPKLEVEKYGINVDIPRYPVLENTAMLNFYMGWLFFCEEPVMAHLQAPYMHKPSYTTKGVIVPGGYDISSWFRKVNAEMHMWDAKGTLTLKDDEPLVYLELITDRPVVFKRFVLTEEIAKYDRACVAAPNYFGRHLPLAKRYKMFRETRTHEILAKEIKKNVLD